MKFIEFAKEFILVFVVTFIVSSLVSFVYSFLVHSEGVFDWSIAFRLSIIFGIIFPWMHFREKKNKRWTINIFNSYRKLFLEYNFKMNYR